jgi:RNA polymerase sigma-70 factor (family 1)
VPPTDDDLYMRLRCGDEKAFGEIYTRYADRLYAHIYSRFRSHDISFEIVQEIFVSLWMRRAEIGVHTSLSGYLFTAVRNQMSKRIRHSKIRETYFQEFKKFLLTESNNSNEETVYLHELEDAVERSLKELPERCAEIFRLSRQNHLSIREIAERLGISHKTVENQLTIALKHLRVSLREFMIGLLAAICSTVQ